VESDRESLSETISIEYELTKREVAPVQRWVMLKAVRIRASFGIALVAIVIGVALVLADSTSNGFGVGLLVVGIGYLVLYGGMVLIMPEVSASKISAGNGPTRLVFSNDGVGIRVKSIDGRQPWSYFSATLQHGDMYLLKLGNRQRSYIFIPKRAFESESDEHAFRQLVNEHTAAQLLREDSL
jgi:YcxB-like protein